MSFEIGGADAFTRAVREAAAWMRARNKAIPDEAFEGEQFDIGGGGDHPAQAVRLNFEGGQVWAAILDDPDRGTLGRTWVTEITVAERNTRVHFGSRLLNVTRGVDAAFEPTLPGVVRQVIGRLSARADQLEISDQPRRVQTEVEIDDLIGLIDDPARILPVLVSADSMEGPAAANVREIARRIAGAAHVYSLDEEATWALTRAFGKSLSVFDGAVRLYRPGFNSLNAEKFEHPLWLPRKYSEDEDRQLEILHGVLSASVRHANNADYPRFDAIRQATVAASLKEIRLTSSDADLSRLFEEENARLEGALRALRAEFDQWLLDTEQDRLSNEAVISELSTDVVKLRSQNNSLRTALRSENTDNICEKLNSYDEFERWCRENISDNVWVAPKAIKEMEKNGIFSHPETIGYALCALDELYVPMRRESNAENRAAYEEKLGQLNCIDNLCFADQNVIKGFPEYAVTYRGRRYWCDRHIKYGGGTDPRNFFRIYYHWHDDDQIVLVGHLPTHLDNMRTN